jgi:hypothetical protein
VPTGSSAAARSVQAAPLCYRSRFQSPQSGILSVAGSKGSPASCRDARTAECCEISDRGGLPGARRYRIPVSSPMDPVIKVMIR